MDFKTMKIEEIIKWCQEHNQVEWLKAEAKREVEVKVYPRIQVEKKTKDKDGKETIKTVSVYDKTQPFTVEKRPISFIQIKKDFCDKFMPELVKHKEKKPSMYELIANL